MKTWITALTLLALTSTTALAEEIKGHIKKIDTEKKTLIVTVDDKDREFTLNKETKFKQNQPPAKKKGTATTADLPGGLNALKVDANVTLTTEKKDGKEVVTEVKVDGAEAPKKKKKTA